MTRVHKLRAASVPSGTARHRQEHRENPIYQVKMETITQKKQLKTYLTYSVRPPRGYTFIPAGDPQLTKKCKKCSKDLDTPVYIVSAGASKTADLSREIHRIGYHFSTAAVDQACQSLGVTLNSSGRVNNTNFNFLKENLNDQNLHLKKAKSRLPADAKRIDGSMSQKLIDFLATQAIRDLFPKIPEKDLREVIHRAFDKRAGLVGTAEGFSLARRANLAVGAHIRHTYTNYDALLKSGDYTWQEARSGVEHFTLDKLVSWRGEEDDNPIIEEVLREVVVIPDEKEPSSTIEASTRPTSNQDAMLPEEVDATAIDLTISDEDDSDDDNEFYRTNPQPPSHQPFLNPATQDDREARDNKHRQVLWRQALDRYKQKPRTDGAKTIANQEPARSSGRHLAASSLNTITSIPGLGEYDGSFARAHDHGEAIRHAREPDLIPFNHENYTRHSRVPPLVQRSNLAPPEPLSLSSDLRDMAPRDSFYQSAQQFNSPVNHSRVSTKTYQGGVRPSIEHTDLERRAELNIDHRAFEAERLPHDHRTNDALSGNTQQREVVYVNSQDRPSKYLPGTRPSTILVPLDDTSDSRRAADPSPFVRGQTGTRYEYDRNFLPDSRSRQHLQQITTQQQSHKPSHSLHPVTAGLSLSQGPAFMPVQSIPVHPVWNQSELADQASPSSKKPRLVRLSDHERKEEKAQPQIDPAMHLYGNARLSSVNFTNDQAFQTHDQAYFPSTGIQNMSIIAPNDSPNPTMRYTDNNGSRIPPRVDEVANPLQPHPRLIRLGPIENGGSNLPAHTQGSQHMSNTSNATSPRQIALGNAGSLGYSDFDRSRPRQLLTSQPEQAIRYISRQW